MRYPWDGKVPKVDTERAEHKEKREKKIERGKTERGRYRIGRNRKSGKCIVNLFRRKGL